MGARLLAVPLFVKILVANAALLALMGFVALAVAQSVIDGGMDRTALAIMIAFVLVALLLGAALNAVLIRVALSPLSSLVATATEVQSGKSAARAQASPLADRRTARLIDVFNSMLDGIEAAGDRQRELAIRVLQAEERERERLSHELYSGTAQTLAGVLVRLRLARGSVNPEGLLPSAEGRASAGHNGIADRPDRSLPSTIRDEVAAALDDIRAVARRLRPPELDDLGLFSAAEAYARTLSEGRGVDVSVRGEVPEHRVDPDTALALFRIFQEAMTNAVHHSEAGHVVARFSPHDLGLMLEVEDDGHGFDVADVFGGNELSLGVTGMRERALYVGGTLTIDSEPGRGTLVRASLPWAPPTPKFTVSDFGHGLRLETAEPEGSG